MAPQNGGVKNSISSVGRATHSFLLLVNSDVRIYVVDGVNVTQDSGLAALPFGFKIGSTAYFKLTCHLNMHI